MLGNLLGKNLINPFAEIIKKVMAVCMRMPVELYGNENKSNNAEVRWLIGFRIQVLIKMNLFDFFIIE